MKLNSYGLKINVEMSKINSQVHDRGNYMVVKTPSNPDYHCGNYIIFSKAPAMGDMKAWQNIYKKEFDYYITFNHMTFSWDTPNFDKGDCREFLDNGYRLDESVYSVAEKINKPPKVNNQIVIEKIGNDEEKWKEVTEIQIMCRQEGYSEDAYRSFKIDYIKDFRKMIKAGHGCWFGAYIDGTLVGDLSIFYQDGIAIFEDVETHPDYRRQGICGTLVYETARIALAEFGIKKFVICADENYHALEIYKSVGFMPIEKHYLLSWWVKNE